MGRGRILEEGKDGMIRLAFGRGTGQLCGKWIEGEAGWEAVAVGQVRGGEVLSYDSGREEEGWKHFRGRSDRLM